MKALLIAATLALAAAPSYAQSSNVYANVAGGCAVGPTAHPETCSEKSACASRRISSSSPTVGQFHNLQPSQAQPTVDSTDATLAAGGLAVTGVARVPAW